MKSEKLFYGIGAVGLIALAFSMISLIHYSRNKNLSGDSQIVVGAVYMTMNNPYFEVISEEIKAIVDSKDDLYIYRDSALDAEIQEEQIEELIKMGVDILIINPVDWIKIEEGIEKAHDANIPVIVVDAPVYDEEYVASSIYSDNATCGLFCAQDLMRRMDSANILFLTHTSNKAARDRINGFKEVLDAKNFDYTIIGQLACGGQLEMAQPVVERFLKTTRGRVDVIVALNDPSALGAMAAFDAVGKLDDVLVYGVDGAPDAKAMIYEGKMTATVAQSPIKTGKYAAEFVYRILAGDVVPKEKIVPVNLITKYNVLDYSLTGWQ